MEVRDLGGRVTLFAASEGPLIAHADDANELIGDAFSTSAEMVIIPVERLSPAFLDLGSRLAGDILQKFTNYGIRVAILGDIAAALTASSALRAYVMESNRGRHVWFAPDMTALEAMAEKAS
jgi:hypothetical protein